jgi:uroporphyrinogen decarboxylase
MNKRQRFLNACDCQAVDHPPIWLMRQAGRALPEYRALREKYSFLQLTQTPELATEVTLQPIRRFDFDAAILFSDILVVPEALGQPYHFREQGGIAMEFALTSPADMGKLNWSEVAARLHYVAQALRLIKQELAGRTALIGFAGSPWTLANFMVQGGSAKEFTGARDWLKADPKSFYRLLEGLTAALVEYLRMQIDAGADVLQIFDTLGGLLEDREFEAASARWLGEIVSALSGRVPVIVFSKRPLTSIPALLNTRAKVLGFDYTVSLGEVRRQLPVDVAVQGNLEPAILTQDRHAVVAGATRILSEMYGRKGFIFNLGHGVPPTTPVENMTALVETVRGFSWLN